MTVPQRVPMSSTKKIILYLFLGFVALGALLIVGGYFWFKSHGAEIAQKSQRLMTEGSTFGRGVTATKCVDEILDRHSRTPVSFRESIQQSLFLTGCLKTASDLPALCAQDTHPGVVSSAMWLGSLCRARGLNDPYCPSVVQPVGEACRRRSTSAPPSA